MSILLLRHHPDEHPLLAPTAEGPGARHRVTSYDQARATAVRQPTAPPLGLGSEDPERVIGFADILALPEADDLFGPGHAEDRRRAYADAEARVAAALWPQHLPTATKKATAKTVQLTRDVRELLALLAEGILIVAELPGGIAALRALVASSASEVSL